MSLSKKNYFILLIIYTFGITACNNSVKQEPVGGEAHLDTPFIQEYHEGFIIDDNIPEANDVRAIHVTSNGNVWIATRNGIYRKLTNETAWSLMISGAEQGPGYDLDSDKKGNIWIAAWDGLYTEVEGELVRVSGPQAPIARVVVTEPGVYALGPKGIWLSQGNNWTKKNYTKARSIRAAIPDNHGGLWIGTDVGLYRCDDNHTVVFQENEDLISAYVTGMDYDNKGNLWVGGLGGVTIRNGVQRVGQKLPENGITNAEVNVVKRAPDGRMWVGTNYGITRFMPGETEYSVRLSKRWLVSDEVRDIDFDQSGNAWIATSGGVSVIKKREMTLEQKADYFYDQLITRHVRDPWIVGRFGLEVPGDTSTLVPDDDDNDGEYTSMYLAMESFRYAVTKDPEAKERAKKAFDFLHYLRVVTGIDGFFARTIVPVDWSKTHDMNRTFTPQQLAEELIANPRQKPVEVRWHISEDGNWMWKGDTSSDELDGHFFGYYWYYYLVADDAEKQRIADHVAKIVDHLIRNNYYLVGVDGTHTKWGVWSPESLNQDPEWAPEKPLNSLEVLSFLKFAHEITGREIYQDQYMKLIVEDGYLTNAKKLYTTNPAWETYFDIYLALYVYPALINGEKNQKLSSEYRTHLDQWFNKFRETNSPLLNFTYNILTDGNDDLDNSIFFLQDAPLDLVDWTIDNGRREDLHLVRKPILESVQVNELRPPSEYRTMRWDRNPYYAVGGNPAQEREPVYWLLPYWMGRYQGLIK